MFLFFVWFCVFGAESERCVCCTCSTSDSATCSFWGMFLGCSILLVVPFELILWTFAFQNANRMDFVHLWMVYFGLLRWSTRKCKHTDCGEAGFFAENIPKQSLVPVEPACLRVFMSETWTAVCLGPCPLTSWVGSTGETELDMSDIANVWNWIWMGWNRWWLWNQDLAAPLRWPMQAMQGEFASHCLLGFGKVQLRQFFARTWNFFDCWIYGLATAILPWSLQASECEHQMSAIWRVEQQTHKPIQFDMDSSTHGLSWTHVMAHAAGLRCLRWIWMLPSFLAARKSPLSRWDVVLFSPAQVGGGWCSKHHSATQNTVLQTLATFENGGPAKPVEWVDHWNMLFRWNVSKSYRNLNR